MIAAGPADLALRSILSEIALTNEVSNGETALCIRRDPRCKFIEDVHNPEILLPPKTGLTCSHELGSCAARSGRTGDITNGAH